MKSVFQSQPLTILLSGLVAGTLDILCAIIFLASGNATGTFRFIAKGALGDAAYEGGPEVIVLGGLIHYIIAFSFATAFFILYPLIPFFKKQKFIGGLLYGVFVWAFMEFLVLPLTHNPPGEFSFSDSWKNILILMLAIGLPISLITNKHFSVRDPETA